MLPTVTARINPKKRDPIVNFAKLVIFTFDQYIEVEQVIKTRREEAEIAKKRNREEKLESKVRKLAEQEETLARRVLEHEEN
jgi:hypothetical protein